jgi:hypothetical protein
MQLQLRTQVLTSIFSASPVDVSQLDEPIETELTKAARGSIDNADKILNVEEFDEDDFVSSGKQKGSTKAVTKKATKQKQRKAERQRKKAKRKK